MDWQTPLVWFSIGIIVGMTLSSAIVFCVGMWHHISQQAFIKRPVRPGEKKE